MGNTSNAFYGHGASTFGARKTGRMRTWFVRVALGLLLWAIVVQLTSVVDLRPSRPLPDPWSTDRLGRLGLDVNATNLSVREVVGGVAKGDVFASSPPAEIPRRVYKSNGYLRMSCNGGLNQMRAAICDMLAIARFLNLTLVLPELDKTSFWGDTSEFKDVFDVKYFIGSLRDEVKIVRKLPAKFNKKVYANAISMAPVSWSNEKYYLKQILPIFRKHKIVHFNKTDTRLANNGLPRDLQRLRCRVNYDALKFTQQINVLGEKLISVLEKSGKFVVLHLRYEMDMLAFTGCTHGCTDQETEELTKMRYAYPWWKEKEIVSEEKRSNGLCPLTPEEIGLILQALDFPRDTWIYIASGEIYGGENRLSSLRAAFPNIVKKESLLHPDELRPLMDHSTQMAALDYLVSVASDVFIPSYDGNMAKVVEGHRRYLGFQRTINLNRKELVKLLDSYNDGSISWADFSKAVKKVHKHRMGQPAKRKAIPGKPKEEDYFYANPQECLGHLHSADHGISSA